MKLTFKFEQLPRTSLKQVSGGGKAHAARICLSICTNGSPCPAGCVCVFHSGSVRICASL